MTDEDEVKLYYNSIPRMPRILPAWQTLTNNAGIDVNLLMALYENNRPAIQIPNGPESPAHYHTELARKIHENNKSFIDMINDPYWDGPHTKENKMELDLKDLSDEQLEERITNYEKSLARVQGSTYKSPSYRKMRIKALEHKLQELVDEQERRIQKDGVLLALLIQEQDWEEDTTICFKRQFNGTGRMYTYAAIRIADGRWYITGRRQTVGLTYDQLVREHLVRAYNETGELWVASEWVKVLPGG